MPIVHESHMPPVHETVVPPVHETDMPQVDVTTTKGEQQPEVTMTTGWPTTDASKPSIVTSVVSSPYLSSPPTPVPTAGAGGLVVPTFLAVSLGFVLAIVL